MGSVRITTIDHQRFPPPSPRGRSSTAAVVKGRRRLTIGLLTLLAVSTIGSAARAQISKAASGNASSSAWLKQAARASFQQADHNRASLHLERLLEQGRAEHAENPSWRGRYEWSRQLTEVAHEYLRAGELSEALLVLGEAADLDVPLRKGLDNGWASAGGGLYRHLTARSSDERYELLHEWSMPTESRRAVRVLEAFVPTVGPPPVFSRVHGERPRDSSFAIAQVAGVSGLFSTAWELVTAADDAGRLRRLKAELERLAEQDVVNARHVLTLARVVQSKRRNEQLLADLTQRLARLRDNLLRDDLPGPQAGTGAVCFDDAWQYGYGKFDDASGRSTDFTPFAVWSGAAWQVHAQRPQGALSFLRIDRTGGHPTVGRPCIRRWTAPADGVLSVTGRMHQPAEDGDGLLGRVVSSRSGVHGEWMVRDGSTETETAPFEVKKNETIDFVVDAIKHTYYDTYVWMVQLHLATSSSQQIYDSVADYCGPGEKRVLADAVTAAACLDREWLRPIGEGIVRELIENTYDTDRWINRPFDYDCKLIRPALRRIWAAAVQKRAGSTKSNLLADAGLRDWVVAPSQTAAQHSQGHVGNTWLAHERHILHLAGAGTDALLFKYPLTGEFEFSYDTQIGGRPGTDGRVAYGGLGFGVDAADELFIVTAGKARLLFPFGGLTARSRRFHGQYVEESEFNRFKLTSHAGEVTFSANGQRVWSDKLNGQASPWIGLQSAGDRNPIFRNLRISGEPIIPREVRLADGDRLRGWSAEFYGESLSPPLPSARSSIVRTPESEKARISNANFRTPFFLASDALLASHVPAEDRGAEPSLSTVGGASPAWFAEDGVIRGSRRASSSEAIRQSRLHYVRPLQDGESISYEFYYQPGELEVHPALGRLAFLVAADGVRLHWMTDGDREWTGLAEDNVVVEHFGRRGPKLLLVVGDWNHVTLELADEALALSLNKQVIYQRRLRPQDERTFGLYHDADRSAVQVRNVVLRGDWPTRLTDEQLDNLAAISDPDRDRADRLALNSLFDDKYIADNILEVRRDAAEMLPPERYEYLADWVLPGRDHAGFRLYGMFSPTHPALPTARYTLAERTRLEEAEKHGGARIQTGGSLFAPALDLIAIAEQLGRLDVLRERVESAGEKTGDSGWRRGRLALLILIDISRRDFESADRQLVDFCQLAVEPAFSAAERWPEMLVFSAALRHREIHQLPGESAFEIAETEIRRSDGTGSDVYDRQLLALTGLKRHFDEGQASIDSNAGDAPLKQWGSRQ